MLAIRMQRIGRKKNAQYRVVAQESSQSPSSGKVVARLGRFDPHTKALELDVPEIEKHIKNGAQPSERVTKLLLSEGIKLPNWISQEKKKDNKTVKNPDKMRKNQPVSAVETDDSVEQEATVADETKEQAENEAEPATTEKASS